MNEEFLRHLVLNSLRMYNNKHSKQYGAMVICAEGKSWRKGPYPEYKACRASGRAESKHDWSEIFSIFTTVLDEIRENIPWKVIQNWDAEADDIIGTLAYSTQEFGQHEDVLIISNDQDFLQLQHMSNVKQFSPMKKKLIKEKDPLGYLKEHIVRGDTGDGVPNIFSKDDVLITEGTRQTPVTKKAFAEILENWDRLAEYLPEEVYRNFQRNELMVDLKRTPDEIKDDIIKQYKDYELPRNGKVLNYLIKKKCRNLVGNVQDFFPKK